MRPAAIAFLALALAGAAVCQDAKPPAVADSEDPALQSHIAYLVKMLDHDNRIIRRSANQGLVAVGKPALPAVEAAAKAGKPRTRGVAARVVKAIHRRAEAAAKKAAEGIVGRKPQDGRRAGRSDARLARVFADLGLDAAHMPQVKQRMAEHRQALRSVKKTFPDLDRKGLRKERQHLTRSYRDDLGKLIGADKVEPFLKAMNSGRGKRKAKKEAGDAGGERKKKNRFERP